MRKSSKPFWKTLPKPFFALAPMADVTDVAFRDMFATHGKPDVLWTEFVSADGLLSPGRPALAVDLLFGNNQRPVVAQLFTSNPDHLHKAGLLVRDMGFDGLDINMGCPDRSVEKQGCGAALINDPDLASALIAAAKKTGLPVSVKTRLGYRQESVDTWIRALLAEDIAALSVHLRTRNDLSKVPARWDLMRPIVALRDEIAPETLVIGNGDVRSVSEGRRRAEASGCDGIMVGRGAFGNPWFFNESVTSVSPQQKITALIEHTKLFAERLPNKHFAIMRKHYKAYAQGFDGAKELRIALMETESAEQAIERARRFLSARP